MYHFFVEPSQIDVINKKATVTGSDFNHIKNVLRMKPGEELSLSNGVDNREYRCAVLAYGDDCVDCELRFIKEDNVELTSKIYLFQGLPKSDKMETVIQKAVELGVYEIIPVAMSRSIVKLDAKKAASRLARWQQISEAAAKQSKRGIIPKVCEVTSSHHAPSPIGERVRNAASVRIHVLYIIQDDKGPVHKNDRRKCIRILSGCDRRAESALTCADHGNTAGIREIPSQCFSVNLHEILSTCHDRHIQHGARASALFRGAPAVKCVDCKSLGGKLLSVTDAGLMRPEQLVAEKHQRQLLSVLMISWQKQPPVDTALRISAPQFPCQKSLVFNIYTAMLVFRRIHVLSFRFT